MSPDCLLIDEITAQVFEVGESGRSARCLSYPMDRRHNAAYKALKVYVGLGGDFTGDHDKASGGQRVRRHTRL